MVTPIATIFDHVRTCASCRKLPVLERGIPEVDREGLLWGNELLLVLHLIYNGKI